jgi:hypothetical protein
MSKTTSPDIASRLRKLAGIAEELRQGSDFPVTRLTLLKRLCQSPDAANRFVVHLAKLTWRKMRRRSPPGHLDVARWSQYKALVGKAIPQMQSYLEDKTSTRASSLDNLLSRVERAQNEYRRMRWGAVRIIESKELLLVEKALRCVLFPHESAYWAYQVAKGYAERYDPDYFDELIPESAPMVEDIADFWCRYHFGMPLRRWLATGKKERE